MLKLAMPPHPRRPRAARGFTLIEGLVSILIFSIGVLALVGLQTTSIQQTTQAQYRSDASLLANELIGQMWVSNSTQLQTTFTGGNATYDAWLARVNAALPGSAASAPTVAIDGTGTVTLTVFWKAPNEPASVQTHSYTTVTQVRR